MVFHKFILIYIDNSKPISRLHSDPLAFPEIKAISFKISSDYRGLAVPGHPRG
jgi:hypothetical protein